MEFGSHNSGQDVEDGSISFVNKSNIFVTEPRIMGYGFTADSLGLVKAYLIINATFIKDR